jgi:hypothetical protein
MHLEYDLTLDELVDANLRLMSHAKPVAAMRRWNYWGGSALTGVGSALVVYLLIPESTAVKLAWAAAAGLAGVILYAFMEPGIVRRRLRRVSSLHTDANGILPVVLDISADNIVEKSPAHQLILDWSQVEEITERPGFVELFGKTVVITIPDRAFKSPAHRVEIVQEAMVSWRKSH